MSAAVLLYIKPPATLLTSIERRAFEKMAG
jgi:hypothetical protein